jgi:hypothetical protein
MKKKNNFFTALLILGTMFPATSQNLPFYVPSIGLTGYWSFSGNANDNSGNNNNGTVSGAVLTTDRYGNANSAYSFNGSTDKITFPQMFQFHQAGDATISMWINANPQPGGLQETFLFSTTIDQDSNRFNFFIYETTVVNTNFDYRGPNGNYHPLISNIVIPKNAWRHFVFTRSGNAYSLYLDGLLKQTFTDNSPQLPNSTGWVIGQNSSEPYDFTGQIDEIAIWSRALTQTEITALYNSCSLFSVTAAPSNQVVNVSGNAQFTLAVAGADGYKWQSDMGTGFVNLSNAGQYSGADNDTLVVSNVTLSNNNQKFRCMVFSEGCSDTSGEAVLSVATGIKAVNGNDAFRIYPNPATGLITVEHAESLNGVPFIITDQIGKTIMNGKLNAGSTSISLDNLPAGIYLFRTGENTSQTFKVLKN